MQFENWFCNGSLCQKYECNQDSTITITHKKSHARKGERKKRVYMCV